MTTFKEIAEASNKIKRNKVFISCEDKKVIAVHLETEKQAIARCHPDDEFNFMTGAKLALERLDEILNPPLYYVKFADRNDSYLNIDKIHGGLLISTSKECNVYKTKFTLDEIKAINPNYLPFAVRVEEDK